MGVAVADYDNDGRPDIFVTGFGRNLLYRNRGNGTFEDVTEQAGVSGADSPHFSPILGHPDVGADLRLERC
jgi:hypothetical protein